MQLIYFPFTIINTNYRFQASDQVMMTLPWIFVVFLTVFFQLSVSQQCRTKFSLDNLLQDQVLINPASPDGPISQVQQYFYPRSFFSSTPRIIASIQAYEVNSFSEINYQLKAAVSRSFVTFTFSSDKMRWVSAKIKFWLTARVDLLVGSFALENIGQSSSSSFNITIPTSFSPFINEKSIHLNFITGVRATTEDDAYIMNVQNAGRNSDNTVFSVKVNTIGQTKINFIEVSYAIFNFELSYFASGGGQLNYVPISGSQYSKIHGSFAPIIYQIEGFNDINLPKNGGFNLEYIFDTDFVLQTKTQNKIQRLSVVYLSIGAQPQGVCSCNQFIMKSGCIDSCPSNTYPFVDYVKGGKSCLTCSSKLNETINEFNTGCVCLEGMQRVGEYCVPKPKIITSCTGNNTVLSGSTCVCVAGTQLVNGVCQTFCKTNEEYKNGKCECSFGYFNISGICGVCSSGRVYDTNVSQCVCPEFQLVGSDGSCVCIANYFLYELKCIRTCPVGTVRSGNTCISDPSVITSCINNQILSNGKCTCSGSNYIINGTCSTCPNLTYYNVTSQTCIMCQANCEICFNFNSCSTCKSGYYYNQTSNSCQISRVCLDNQVLINGMCDCAPGFVEVNGVCGKCLAGEYYNASKKTCEKCFSSCLSCTDSVSCASCLPNYAFNSVIKKCLPVCGANQTLVNDLCQCIAKTFRINGVCSKCPSDQFYDFATKTCRQCTANCLACTSATVCDKCILTHYVNPTTKTCEPSNCPVNQTITNGKCDCVKGTLRISGACSTCNPGQEYNNITQVCKQCADNCTICRNPLQCQNCQPYFNQINGECRFNLYDKKDGYPQFLQNVIITDFASSQPSKTRKLSAEELNKIVKITFDPQQNQPSQTLIQQNPKNTSEIRVIFSYCGYVPLTPFNATYTFNDRNISVKEDIDLVRYNLMDKGLTNYLA